MSQGVLSKREGLAFVNRVFMMWHSVRSQLSAREVEMSHGTTFSTVP